MATRRKKSRKPPWKRGAPRDAKHHKLSPRRKASAKASAKRAGRRYPNLVDNMRAAAKGAGGRKGRSAKNRRPPGKRPK
jgi:hypothetical protein